MGVSSFFLGGHALDAPSITTLDRVDERHCRGASYLVSEEIASIYESFTPPCMADVAIFCCFFDHVGFWQPLRTFVASGRCHRFLPVHGCPRDRRFARETNDPRALTCRVGRT